MITHRPIVLTVLAAMLLTIGCASKPQQTGFLSSYSNLEPNGPNGMRYLGPKLGQYSKFILDPVTVKFYDPESEGKISQEDIDHLKSFFHDQLQQDLSVSYTLVTEPGPGVARLRVAITDLKPGTPALNVLPQTKLTGLGLGAASAEAELVDSVTGEQLAAGIDSQTGSRLSFSGLSKWGDAEAVMKDWSKKIVAKIDAAHGSGT
jgi:hypothetical protein